MPDKAIFLDRDDTLIQDPGYVNDPGQVKLLEGVPRALIAFKAMGYKLVVVSNQSAVARGMVTEKVLDEIHDRLRALLIEKGASLDKIYYCPYHPQGVVPKYRRESDSRKPNPGMLVLAADEMDIALDRSWMIGNSIDDVEAGMRAGCKTILLDNLLHNNSPAAGETNPDFRAVNLREAVNIIKQYQRSISKPAARNKIISNRQADESEPETVPAEPDEKHQIPTDAPVRENLSENSQILKSILEQLKSMQRSEMFGEFSLLRMMAGIVQMLVFFCLLISVLFIIDPDRPDSSIFISLGFAVVLQIMSLTFYMMQGRK